MSFRKEYHTSAERRADRIRGFWTCLVANITLFIIGVAVYFLMNQNVSSAEIIGMLWLWVINIGFIAYGLVFRPEFAVGYLAFLAALIVGGIVLGVLFLTACFLGIGTAFVLSPLGDIGSMIAVCGVFPIAFLAGLYFLFKAFLPLATEWWRGE